MAVEAVFRGGLPWLDPKEPDLKPGRFLTRERERARNMHHSNGVRGVDVVGDGVSGAHLNKITTPRRAPRFPGLGIRPEATPGSAEKRDHFVFGTPSWIRVMLSSPSA